MPAKAKTKRVRKDPEVRRAELVEAATRMFLKKGYKATSVDDIVKAAGVSKGTFYLYFSSKPEILTAIIEQVQLNIFTWLGEIMASDRNPEEKLLDGLEGAFKEYQQSEEILRVFELAGPEAAHERLRSRGWEQSKPMLVFLIQQGIDEGLFQVDDLDGTVDLVMVLVSELQHLVISPYSKVDAESGTKLLKRALGGLLK